MGIFKLSLISLKKDMSKSIFYFLTFLLTTIFIFSFFNLTFNSCISESLINFAFSFLYLLYFVFLSRLSSLSINITRNAKINNMALTRIALLPRISIKPLLIIAPTIKQSIIPKYKIPFSNFCLSFDLVKSHIFWVALLKLPIHIVVAMPLP